MTEGYRMRYLLLVLGLLLTGCGEPTLQPGEDAVTLDLTKAKRSDGTEIDYAGGDIVRVVEIRGATCLVYASEVLSIDKRCLIPLRGAEEKFTQRIGAKPDDPKGWYFRGNFYQARGELEKSIADATKAIELAPQIAAYYALRAEVFDELGRHQEADDDYSAALAILPDAHLTRARRARVLSDLKRLDDALSEADVAVEGNPQLAEAWAIRGWIWHRKGNAELAQRDLGRAVMLNPMNAEHHFHLGVVRRRCGELDFAEREFERVVELDPANRKGAVAFNLAAISYARGDRQKGRQIWDEYRAVNAKDAKKLEAVWGTPEAEAASPM